jgi:hypothetical protein
MRKSDAIVLILGREGPDSDINMLVNFAVTTYGAGRGKFLSNLGGMH